MSPTTGNSYTFSSAHYSYVTGGSGAGTNGAAYGGIFFNGASITLTASPGAGYTFTNWTWSGFSTGSGAPGGTTSGSSSSTSLTWTTGAATTGTVTANFTAAASFSMAGASTFSPFTAAGQVYDYLVTGAGTLGSLTASGSLGEIPPAILSGAGTLGSLTASGSLNELLPAILSGAVTTNSFSSAASIAETFAMDGSTIDPPLVFLASGTLYTEALLPDIFAGSLSGGLFFGGVTFGQYIQAKAQVGQDITGISHIGVAVVVFPATPKDITGRGHISNYVWLRGVRTIIARAIINATGPGWTAPTGATGSTAFTGGSHSSQVISGRGYLKLDIVDEMRVGTTFTAWALSNQKTITGKANLVSVSPYHTYDFDIWNKGAPAIFFAGDSFFNTWYHKAPVVNTSKTIDYLAGTIVNPGTPPIHLTNSKLITTINARSRIGYPASTTRGLKVLSGQSRIVV